MAKAATRASTRAKTGGKSQAHHWWWFALLGIVMVAGGTFMLGNLAAATVVSKIFIGATFVVLGAFQIVKAFSTKVHGFISNSSGRESDERRAAIRCLQAYLNDIDAGGIFR